MSTDAAPRERVLAWEKRTRPIAIRPELVRITGSVDGAYLLSQILYWFGEDETGQTRARVEHDGETWIAKTPAAWATELGYVTADGEPRTKILRRVIHNLKAEGLVETVAAPFNGSPTTHIRPCWDAIAGALPHLPKRSHAQTGECPNGRMHSPTAGKSSKETETTTKTTGLNQAGGGSGSEGGVVPADAGTAAAPSATGVVESTQAKRATGQPREKPARTPTEQQRYFEAVAKACGLDPSWLAETDRANVGKLASQLQRDAELDLDFLAECARRWPEQWPNRDPATIAPPTIAQLRTWIGRCKGTRVSGGGRVVMRF